MPFWGMKFLTFKMAAISQGPGHFMSYSRTRCPSSQAMSLLSFVGITKIDLEKSANMWILATILGDLEQLGRYFVLHTRTSQGMCLQNITGISVIMRALDPGQRFEHTFWILLLPSLPLILCRRQQQLQRHQKHLGPTLHVVIIYGQIWTLWSYLVGC